MENVSYYIDVITFIELHLVQVQLSFSYKRNLSCHCFGILVCLVATTCDVGHCFEAVCLTLFFNF